MKNIRIFYLKNCHFLVVKFSVYLNRRVFVMMAVLLRCNIVITLRYVGLNFILFASITRINNRQIHIMQDLTLSQMLVQR